MNHVCVRCGKAFQFTRAKPYKFQSESLDDIPAGSPMRSHTINTFDPAGKFCTLRCAAVFGVAAANSLKPAPITKETP